MKKFSLISLLLFSSLLSTPPALALTLKIATLAPAGTSWMKEMKKGAKAIKKKTASRVKIKFYPGGVMGNDQSVHRKIRINQLQGGAFSSSGLSHVDSAIQLLSLPMVFQSFEEVDYVRARMDDKIKQHMADSGFIILGLSEAGFARILSTRPLKNLQDIRESKVWIPEGDKMVQDTFDAMSITPIALPLSDVFTGLQTGLIETITTTSTGAIAFQWHSKVTNMLDVPVLYVIGVLAVNQKAFSKIKPQDQKIVIEEMNRVFATMDTRNRQDNINATQALKTQGIAVVTPSQQEIQLWRDLSAQSIQHMIDSKGIDKDLVDELLRHLADFRKQ